MSFDPGATELPLDEDAAAGAAGFAFECSGAGGVEVVVSASSTGLTRFANSQIIQNTARDEVRAYVRVALEDRYATAATNQLQPEHMRAAADRALRAARAAPPDHDWPGLARPEDVGRAASLWRYDTSTALTLPARRAEVVAEMLRVSGDLDAAGIYETSAHCFGVFTSTGISCFDGYTRCVANVLVDSGSATGWAEGSSHECDAVDHYDVATRAVGKVGRGPAVSEATPGDYQVVLEPPAAAELVDYLAFVGFGAKQVLDGESFLATKAGKEVAARSVTVADDASHPLSVGIGFDFEGVPRKRVEVIDEGRATQPVTDRRTAAKLGLPVTGHASGSDEYGPWPMNVLLESGPTAPDELVRGVDEGLLVTRFHYVNVLDRPTTLLTGMTRDGTFRIRGGEIAEPVQNLRFTQGALDTLASTSAIGSDPTAFAPEFGAFGYTVSPSLRVDEFRFTSKTSH